MIRVDGWEKITIRSREAMAALWSFRGLDRRARRMWAQQRRAGRRTQWSLWAPCWQTRPPVRTRCGRSVAARRAVRWTWAPLRIAPCGAACGHRWWAPSGWGSSRWGAGSSTRTSVAGLLPIPPTPSHFHASSLLPQYRQCGAQELATLHSQTELQPYSPKRCKNLKNKICASFIPNINFHYSLEFQIKFIQESFGYM